MPPGSAPLSRNSTSNSWRKSSVILCSILDARYRMLDRDQTVLWRQVFLIQYQASSDRHPLGGSTDLRRAVLGVPGNSSHVFRGTCWMLDTGGIEPLSLGAPRFPYPVSSIQHPASICGDADLSPTVVGSGVDSGKPPRPSPSFLDFCCPQTLPCSQDSRR